MQVPHTISEHLNNTEQREAQSDVWQQHAEAFRVAADPDLSRDSVKDIEADSVFDETIISVAKRHDISVRLNNVLLNASQDNALPVKTVRDYMSDRDTAYREFKRIRNVGRKTADELDRFIVKAQQQLDDFEKLDHPPQERDGQQDNFTYQDIIYRTCKALLQGLQFPAAFFDLDISVRLRHILQNSDFNYISLSEFIKDYSNVEAKLRHTRNCGRKTLWEFRQNTLGIIHDRLIELGLPQQHAETIFGVLSGDGAAEGRKNELLTDIQSHSAECHSSPHRDPFGELSLEDYIARILESLDERQRDVLRRRYGLNGREPETLEGVAKDFDLTRERIRQIERRALTRLATGKVTRRLRARLADEEIIPHIFAKRKLVLQKHCKEIGLELSHSENFAIDLAYGCIDKFFDKEAIPTEIGWVLDENVIDKAEEIQDLETSLRSRLRTIIHQSNLPITLTEIQSQIPDYSVEVICNEMKERFEAQFDGNELVAAPRLPASTRFILILRHAGHSLHCNEIRAKNYEFFGRDDSIHYIGSVLGRLLEVLIVARGTYNLYKNLSLSDGNIQEIRDRVYHFLSGKGEYISTKVMFSQLFQGDTERFGQEFDYMMLLGILQDDERFDVRRGLMVGLTSFGPDQGYMSLQDEVRQILEESNRPLSVGDVMDQLEGRREVFETAISSSFEAFPDVVLVSRGRYDLASRAIGSEETQNALRMSCSLALTDGPKSVLAISELLENVGQNIEARTLKSFLGKQEGFEIVNTGIKIIDPPEGVREYEAALKALADEAPEAFDDLEEVRKNVVSRGAPDLTKLDPRERFGRKTRADGEQDGAMLQQLLGEFGL